MSIVLWILVSIFVVFAIDVVALKCLVPRNYTGALLLKTALRIRGVPYDHLPSEFFSECVQRARRLSEVIGRNPISRRAEFVSSIENLANMVDLWRREPDSPMFRTHGSHRSSYTTLFESYDLRRAP